MGSVPESGFGVGGRPGFRQQVVELSVRPSGCQLAQQVGEIGEGVDVVSHLKDAGVKAVRLPPQSPNLTA